MTDQKLAKQAAEPRWWLVTGMLYGTSCGALLPTKGLDMVVFTLGGMVLGVAVGIFLDFRVRTPFARKLSKALLLLLACAWLIRIHARNAPW